MFSLQWVIPEIVGQCVSTVLMLVSMHWFIFLLNLPVAAWDVYRYPSLIHAHLLSGWTFLPVEFNRFQDRFMWRKKRKM